MTDARITCTLDDKDYRAALTKLGGVLRTGIQRAIGAALVEVVRKRFESGTEPFGPKWKPLLPAYAAIKQGPGILRASGMLQRSVTYEVSGNTIAIGSNRIYAAVHRFGATIEPKNGKASAFRQGATGKRGGEGGEGDVAGVCGSRVDELIC